VAPRRQGSTQNSGSIRGWLARPFQLRTIQAAEYDYSG
jgi:hypothetical protein